MSKVKIYTETDWQEFSLQVRDYASTVSNDITWSAHNYYDTWCGYQNDIIHRVSKRCATAHVISPNGKLVGDWRTRRFVFWFPNKVTWNNKTHKLLTSGSGGFFDTPALTDDFKKALDDFVKWRKHFIEVEQMYVSKLKAFENAIKFMINSYDSGETND